MQIDQELLEAVLVAVAALIGGGLGLALTALILKYAAKWFKDFQAIVRDYTPQVVQRVDQPTDPALVQLDKWLDRLYPYNWNTLAAKVLPAMLRAAADAITEQDAAPPQEAAPLPERGDAARD